MSYDARSEAVALMTAMGYSRYQEVTVKRIAEALQRAFLGGTLCGAGTGGDDCARPR